MEALAAIGGAAAILQLLNVVVKTGAVILHFIEGFRDIPEELRRLKILLISIGAQLRTLRDHFIVPTNDLDIQPHLLSSLHITLLEVQKDVEAVAAITKLYDTSTNSKSLRKRINFYLLNQKVLEKCVRRLAASARDLQSVADPINLSLICSIYRSTIFHNHHTTSPQEVYRSPKRLTQPVKSRYALSKLGSSLRGWGVYGCFIDQKNKRRDDSEILIYLGLCISILSRSMQQFLKEGKAGINDQTACSGKTALMVAIEAKQMAAVEFLLQHNADPNIPDDDQILPVFAVAGMDLHRSRYFEQLPPTWDQWLDVLRLLIDSGASVHEIVRDRNLAGLNIAAPADISKVLPFLRLLAAEDALDLDVAAEFDQWPVLKNVFEAGKDSVDALKLVTGCGLSLTKVLIDGQTVLHLAAQYCSDSEVLTHLLTTPCVADINRQDRWGWTPLHYTVMSRHSAEGPTPYANAVLFLQRGADSTIRGRAHPGSPYQSSSDDFTCFELLEHNRYTRFELLVDTLKNAGIEITGVTDATNEFYDVGEYPIAYV
ncbi:MAG: hypothetical protein Q9225_007138 [Loekoesia sp. 1 TL-2023]